MNTSEAARKWKCSVGTVRKYCSEGMILAAEKNSTFPWGWDIPDEACKPPVTRHKAAVIMCMASAACKGGEVVSASQNSVLDNRKGPAKAGPLGYSCSKQLRM